MEKEIYLYPYSAAEARTRNELALWRASYQANEECARDIEEHIRTHFDGAHLDDSMLQPLLDKWGYKRINFVLANTLQELSYDGRFSRKNRYSQHLVNGQISSCGIGWVRKYGARGLQESWPLRATAL